MVKHRTSQVEKTTVYKHEGFATSNCLNPPKEVRHERPEGRAVKGRRGEDGVAMGAIAAEQSNDNPEQQQQTPKPAVAITPSQFALWKKRKDAEAAAKAAEVARKRAEDITAGRVRMTGRELHLHEPWVFDDSRFE